MKHFYILLCLACFLWEPSLAQDQSIPENSIQKPPRWVVKFAPLSMLDMSNTIQFGVERFIGTHQSVQVEAGYGWQSMNIWSKVRNSSYTNYETWRGRAEWRFYWFNRNHQLNRPLPFGAYTAIEGLYRTERAIENGTVGVGADGSTAQFDYYRLYSSPTTRKVWAVTVKIGRQFPISQNGRLVGDFYAGIGFCNRTIVPAIRPDGYLFQTSTLFSLDSFSSALYQSVNTITLNMALGIKIGYSF